MKKLITIGSFVAMMLPAVAFADSAGNDLTGLIQWFGRILSLLIPILIALALIAFFWGLVRYVWGNGGEGAADGRKIMIAGITALFVMVSVWGIIRLAQNTLLGGVSGGSIAPPTVQGI